MNTFSENLIWNDDTKCYLTLSLPETGFDLILCGCNFFG